MNIFKKINNKPALFLFLGIILFIFIGLFNQRKTATVREAFRFHIRTDLDSLDPIDAQSSISSYLVNALHSPLLKYQHRKISSGGAESCVAKTETLYECELRKDWRWSDGRPVTAQEIVEGFLKLKQSSSPHYASFNNIKNLSASTARHLAFELFESDSDFLYRLIDPAISPIRNDMDRRTAVITSGPYSLFEHTKGRSLYLKPNIYFSEQPAQVDIEILIIDSDDAALRMYESKQLNFLRRLTTGAIPIYKGKPDFFQVPFYRFDYIGFGPELLPHPQLRRDLALSLNPVYDQFVPMFDALGRPGCFGMTPFASELSSDNIEKSQYDLCFEKSKIKKYSSKDKQKIPKLILNYSASGDDDLRRSMELFQFGWKNALDLEIEIAPIEQVVFTQALKESPPTLFRRGVSLERPTCLAALEVFESSSPNNFIRFNEKQYDKIVAQMRRAQSESDLRLLCAQGVRLLRDSYRLIPMGALHYTMLTDHKFDNFFINEFNQIDVSRLSLKISQ